MIQSKIWRSFLSLLLILGLSISSWAGHPTPEEVPVYAYQKEAPPKDECTLLVEQFKDISRVKTDFIIRYYRSKPIPSKNKTRANATALWGSFDTELGKLGAELNQKCSLPALSNPNTLQFMERAHSAGADFEITEELRQQFAK